MLSFSARAVSFCSTESIVAQETRNVAAARTVGGVACGMLKTTNGAIDPTHPGYGPEGPAVRVN